MKLSTLKVDKKRKMWIKSELRSGVVEEKKESFFTRQNMTVIIKEILSRSWRKFSLRKEHWIWKL